MADPILVAKGDHEIFLLPRMANRHGLVAGATGTGKTVTLQRLAEGFSRLGVPVFMADVKGDLSGVCRSGEPLKPAVAARVKELGLTVFRTAPCSVEFWDVFGEEGHPVRATIASLGPLLLARLLGLNDIQSGVLSITFRVAADNGLPLIDMKDLRAMLQYVSENAHDLASNYGNVSAASIGAIQRGLLRLEEQGGVKFFGEPALDLMDLLQTGPEGQGVVNVLAADKLIRSPQLYATFLLWLLSELFERLPEVGDPDKPVLVFFFDEAHLLFTDAPKPLLEKIEQIVRLIRSKGVGVYFVTQNPTDLPDTVLGQLGNRVQHALRAFTAHDQKGVRAAAETFRANPDLDIAAAIMQLKVGEALVSFLDDKGAPAMVQRAQVVPPGSQIGPITAAQRADILKTSVLAGHYEKAIDRESAYEILKKKEPDAAAERPAPRQGAPVNHAPADMDTEAAERRAEFERRRSEEPAQPRGKRAPAGPRTDSVFLSFVKSLIRSLGSGVGRALTKLLSNILKNK